MRTGPVLLLLLVLALVGGCTTTPQPPGRSPIPPTSSGQPTAGTSRTPTPTGPKRPNIVFVLTDDLSWNMVRYLPQVKALQASGTTFTNFFTVDSLCCPSRAAIFTGQYPHNNGVFRNIGSDGGYRGYRKNGNDTKSFAVALQPCLHVANHVTGHRGVGRRGGGGAGRCTGLPVAEHV